MLFLLSLIKSSLSLLPLVYNAPFTSQTINKYTFRQIVMIPAHLSPPSYFQLSPKQSPPNVAPPPPPPPPPLLDGPLSPSKPPLANGDVMSGGMPNGNLIMGQMHQLKKIPPQEKIAYEDPRSDLMKAIRDGKGYLLETDFGPRVEF